MKFGLVVLGAHFGVWLDDIIQKYKEDNILLVEPVPYNYKILKKNFEEFSNIHICTNAIYSSNKTDFFYYVKENSISKLRKHWASQIGSFKKQHILDHKSKRFKIEESDIIKYKDFESADVILFDTPGMERSIKFPEELLSKLPKGEKYALAGSISEDNVENLTKLGLNFFDLLLALAPLTLPQ